MTQFKSPLDAAFERRTHVEVYDGEVIRVMSDPAPPVEVEQDAIGVNVTRMSTQVQEGGVVSEVVSERPPGDEPARTFHPTTRLMCTGAYQTNRPIQPTRTDKGFISKVVKQLPASILETRGRKPTAVAELVRCAGFAIRALNVIALW